MLRQKRIRRRAKFQAKRSKKPLDARTKWLQNIKKMFKKAPAKKNDNKLKQKGKFVYLTNFFV